MDQIEGVVLTPQKRIETPLGDIYHALKKGDSTFTTFGEAYFSTVGSQQIKGWKKHKEMVLNIVVPVGQILFVLYDDRPKSPTFGCTQEVVLSKSNYQRLTVPPMVWMAFQGHGEHENMLLNIASIPHNPHEAENIPLDNPLIPYVW